MSAGLKNVCKFPRQLRAASSLIQNTDRHDIITRIADVNLADNIWAAECQYRAVTCTYAQNPDHTQPQSRLGTAVTIQLQHAWTSRVCSWTCLMHTAC